MPIIGWCLSLSSDIGPLTCVILSSRNHGFVRPFHNAARFRPSTRQAGLRNRPPLPQGPVRIVFRIPQPPGPRTDRATDLSFRPALRRPFVFERSEVGCQRLETRRVYLTSDIGVI